MVFCGQRISRSRKEESEGDIQLSEDSVCPFFDEKTHECLVDRESEKLIPNGRFGGCLTPKYSECDAYKYFKWRLKEKVLFS